MTQRRYRIAHLITLLELGGAQQNTLYSVRHHDRSRFDVELISGSGGRLDQEARSIPDAKVDLVDWIQHPIRPWADLRAIWKLRDHLRARRIDLLHTHSSKAGILGRIAAQLAGVPAVVHTVHGWSFNETQPFGQQQLYRTLERCMAPLCDKILVVAARHRESGLAAGIGHATQYRVVRSGIDPQLYVNPTRPAASIREEFGFGEGCFVVGTVANMKPQKAPLDFVAVAARAYRENRQLRFVMAGDGPLKGEVEAAIEREGLTEIVKLLGWRDDVADLLHGLDCFLLTSHFEGLPRVVLQAIAAGRPIVATAVDGTPEVVRPERSGWLANAGDIDGLARGLIECSSKPEVAARYANGARASLRGSFNIKTMVRELDALYLSLLSGRC